MQWINAQLLKTPGADILFRLGKKLRKTSRREGETTAPPVCSRVNNKDQVKSMATMILGRANLSSVCEALGIASVKVLNPVQACFLRLSSQFILFFFAVLKYDFLIMFFLPAELAKRQEMKFSNTELKLSTR